MALFERLNNILVSVSSHLICQERERGKVSTEKSIFISKDILVAITIFVVKLETKVSFITTIADKKITKKTLESDVQILFS